MKTVLQVGPMIPAEWIEAHGFRARAAVPAAAPDAQMGQCAWAHAVAVLAEKGGGGDNLVVAASCDQMRRAMANPSVAGKEGVFLMSLPATWQTPASRRLYEGELRRLGRFLVSRGGLMPTPERLRQAMRRCASRRRRVAGGRTCPPGKIPLALVGGPWLENQRAILERIQFHGGWVALDGMENGERSCPAPFDEKGMRQNPFRELARAYFDVVPDVFRRPNDRLFDWLGENCEKRGVRGVLVIRQVWCDLWHAETPRIRDCAGAPLLDLDLAAEGLTPGGRTDARLQAFLETLR
ncbi:MAG: 2-hydroxyacyl-CoA dehydratase family protein [Verrucomicrobiae bacterium]|nr:2-hydroxyacyl-CoA dehydratase family protein [Verrucomicrobiae bacterium]